MAAPIKQRGTVPPHQLKVVTPLSWKVWQAELQELGLLTIFSDVPTGLRYGFATGVSSRINKSFIPPNHASALLQPSIVSEHIQKELKGGRYSGPFLPSQLESIIGPFRTAPLGLVPKPNSAQFCIIQDLSYPRQDPRFSSVNSEINSDDFPCEWGTFPQCYFLVASAPIGTQAAVFDVEAAYRNIPIAPVDQPHFCLSWEGNIYIDHCAPFGSASACGLFGRVADAFVAICKEHGVQQILKWVDDMVTFCFPIASASQNSITFSYDSQLLFKIANHLGWPWAIHKHKDFSETFTYLGFSWDLRNRTVEIPPSKKDKYLSRLQPWAHKAAFTLRQAQELAGALNHCSLVISQGRSHMHHLNRFIASFSSSTNPFVKHSVNFHLSSEIIWWKSQLALPFVGRNVLVPPPPISAQIYIDASTSWGIGLLIDGNWLAWKFAANALSDGRDIGWGEMVAVELAVSTLSLLFPSHSHFLINSDNQGVIGAINSGHSCGFHQNTSLSRFCTELLHHDNFISAKYINTTINPADPILRGLLPSIQTSLKLSITIDPSISCFLIPVP